RGRRACDCGRFPIRYMHVGGACPPGCIAERSEEDMSQILIGCVPLTFGRFRESDPGAWPEDQVLQALGEAGYQGVASGPREGQTPQKTAQRLAQYGLKPAPGYLGGVWWQPDQHADLVEKAKRLADFAQQVGLTELFVAPRGTDQK